MDKHSSSPAAIGARRLLKGAIRVMATLLLALGASTTQAQASPEQALRIAGVACKGTGPALIDRLAGRARVPVDAISAFASGAAARASWR